MTSINNTPVLLVSKSTSTLPIIPEPLTAHLSWNAPVLNTDNSRLTDLAGFKIYYGPEMGNPVFEVDVPNPNRSELTLAFDPSNEGVCHYFSMTAYNSINIESSMSEEVSKCF